MYSIARFFFAPIPIQAKSGIRRYQFFGKQNSFFKQVLGLVDLCGEVGGAPAVWVVEEHDLLVGVLDPLGRRVGGDAQDERRLPFRHLALEAALVVLEE